MPQTFTENILTAEQAQQKLKALKQEKLWAVWEELSPTEKQLFLRGCTLLDGFLLERLKSVLSWPLGWKTLPRPLQRVYEREPGDADLGRRLIGQGKCACLVVAGGQGSRLGYDRPKGCFPTTLVRKKSLFQLLAERVLAASRQMGCALEVAIMTSPENHRETELFFIEHTFFGLSSKQVHFFPQRQLPFLDQDEHLFFSAPGEIAYGPNGNGGALARLVEVGLWEKWARKGVEMVQFLPIDNALALPFDPTLAGFHARMGNEVTLKATRRTSSKEKVGVIATREGAVGVVEYSELPEEMRSLDLFPYANMSLFCFDMGFIKRASEKSPPLHAMKKQVKGQWAWKFEEFIFDLLCFSSKTEVLLYPREEIFAPLKDAGSLTALQEALLAQDGRLFEQIAGHKAPTGRIFELAQSFVYPTEELRAKWKDQPFPDASYLE